MTRYIIALLELGIKNSNILSLLQEHFSDIKSMFNNEKTHVINNNLDLLLYSGFFNDSAKVNNALEKADNILKKNIELEIKTTYFTNPAYPKELAQMDNPPVIIYYKGAEFTDLPKKSIACVGTRNPTKLSYNAVNYLIPQWVHEGCMIISGLANGVDELSHQACISAGGKTIAVLAHGLDTIYPKDNFLLSERILESGGILMSEYPIGTKGDRFRFVDRNRLIVGMSQVVVIYECDEKSGTMHNVEYAIKQKKSIFCPAIGSEIIQIQTGTKKLLDDRTAIEIKEGRDISGVLSAMGYSIEKERLSNFEIKQNYLKSLLYIMNEKSVFDVILNTFRLNIDSNMKIEGLYNFIIEKVKSGKINIDKFISFLVLNNIRSNAKTMPDND